jgi:hypothetical protein
MRIHSAVLTGCGQGSLETEKSKPAVSDFQAEITLYVKKKIRQKFCKVKKF